MCFFLENISMEKSLGFFYINIFFFLGNVEEKGRERVEGSEFAAGLGAGEAGRNIEESLWAFRASLGYGDRFNRFTGMRVDWVSFRKHG